MKKHLLSFAMAAFGLMMASTANAAIVFSFDPDGAGTGVAAREVTTFDFKPGNALADNALLGTPTLVPGTEFNLYYQAVLGEITNAAGATTITQFSSGSGGAAFIDIAGLPAIPQGQITAVAGFREVVTDTSVAINGDVTSSFALAAGGPNFLKLYYDPLGGANDLAGTGFDDGQLILDAVVTRNSGSFTVDVSEGTNKAFDGVGPNNYPGVTSVTGAGGVELAAQVLTFDATFFGAGFNPGLITLALFNTSNITPFNQVNPSGQFSPDGVAGGAVIIPGVGPINGVSGPDFQFQADANASFAPVPEPSSLAILSLLGLGGALPFRKRNRVTA